MTPAAPLVSRTAICSACDSSDSQLSGGSCFDIEWQFRLQPQLSLASSQQCNSSIAAEILHHSLQKHVVLHHTRFRVIVRGRLRFRCPLHYCTFFSLVQYLPTRASAEFAVLENTFRMACQRIGYTCRSLSCYTRRVLLVALLCARAQ
jgi:hypothetical protein